MQPTNETLPLLTEDDVVRVRQAVRRMTQGLGFSIVDQTKMVTAASELARNTLIYGGGGAVDAEIVTRDASRGLKLVFRDEGPGIPDIATAMKDGWTSGSGMGLGLPGAKRLVNEFAIDTAVGKGTRVTIIRWK